MKHFFALLLSALMVLSLLTACGDKTTPSDCANTVPALRLNLPFSPMRFLSAEIPFLKRLSG